MAIYFNGQKITDIKVSDGGVGTTYYQHNIKMYVSNGYVCFNFTNKTSTAYTNLSSVLSAMLTLGINRNNNIMATGCLGTFICSSVYARANLTIDGMDITGTASTKEISTITSITDVVLPC